MTWRVGANVGDGKVETKGGVGATSDTTASSGTNSMAYAVKGNRQMDERETQKHLYIPEPHSGHLDGFSVVTRNHRTS